MTVSNAFRYPERVQARTREAVLNVAAELGYVPNLSAGLLAAGLVAISPRNIVYTSVVSTENLFTFLLLLGAVLMTSREFGGKYVLLGITGAFLAFTKPFMLLFPGYVNHEDKEGCQHFCKRSGKPDSPVSQ